MNKKKLLPFLDILVINNIHKLECKVQHTTTNENNNIHFYLQLYKTEIVFFFGSPPTKSVLDMTLDHLMARFEEFKIPLH